MLFRSDRTAAVGQSDVRLSGHVADGTIVRDAIAGTLAFQVTDGTRRLDVQYRGVVPDAFKDGREIVVTGHMENGVFQADRGTLITLCPSKFMQEQADQGKTMPAIPPAKGSSGT